MPHCISGLIARREVLKHLDGQLAEQPYFALAEGLAFMPLDEENLNEVVGLQGGDRVAEFFYLTERLIELLCLASRDGDLAYIETDYHGGNGGQGAVLFRDGEMVSAPDWREGNAINDALSRMGVSDRRRRLDAFEAVGLDIYRDNRGYREKGTIVRDE